MKWGGLDRLRPAELCYKPDLVPRNLCVSKPMGGLKESSQQRVFAVRE
jgi:hypothetical protein